MSGQLAKFGLIASMLSVVGSLYIYFVGSDEMLGIFVGLWAPTLILATKEIEEWMENKS
jgi:Sec-independent protein secretion pathway component TatC